MVLARAVGAGAALMCIACGGGGREGAALRGIALAWHWPSTARALPGHWPGTGRALPGHWPGTGLAMAWHWPSTARALPGHWPGTAVATGRGGPLCDGVGGKGEASTEETTPITGYYLSIASTPMMPHTLYMYIAGVDHWYQLHNVHACTLHAVLRAAEEHSTLYTLESTYTCTYHVYDTVH